MRKVSRVNDVSCLIGKFKVVLLILIIIINILMNIHSPISQVPFNLLC